MRMPYWQFLLHIGLLSLAAHRAVAAYVWIESDVPWVLVACFVAQAVFALLAAIAMWLRLSLQVAAVIALAAVVVVTSVVQAFALGEGAVPLSVGQAGFAILAATGVVMALRHADRHPDGTASR